MNTTNAIFNHHKEDQTMKATILDDGTLDTVVKVEFENGCKIIARYDSEYRYSFDSFTEFLNSVVEEFMHEA